MLMGSRTYYNILLDSYWSRCLNDERFFSSLSALCYVNDELCVRVVEV